MTDCDFLTVCSNKGGGSGDFLLLFDVIVREFISSLFVVFDDDFLLLSNLWCTMVGISLNICCLDNGGLRRKVITKQ